ncbi:MAG: AAA family ATPase, partial [Thermorudis peleae]|nr:AAA family ATPase [Thermorudis peleae]
DPDLPWLVHFYSIYRAHVRAKVACFRSDDIAPELPEALAVRTEAERYIDLATSYVIEPARPMLLLVGGLSGTGKSALARRLARSLGTTLASSDLVRKQLAGRSPTSYAPVPYGAGIYTEQLTTQTYETLLNQAAQALLSGHSVVLDATFLDATWRERARDLAQNAGADVLLIECQCPEPVVQQRLQARPQEPGQVSEATWAIYQEQRRRYGPVMKQTAGLPHLVVTTDRPTAQVLDDVLRALPLRRRL